MNKLNKRIFLSAGTALVIAAPVITVVSCGTSYAPTKEEMDAHRDLTSPMAYKFIENLWQEKVISTKIDTTYAPTHELVDTPDTTDGDKKIPQHTYWDLATNKGQMVHDAAQYVIRARIATDPEYLKKMGDSLSQSGKNDEKDPNNTTGKNRYDKSWLVNNGILMTYPNGNILFGVPAGTPANGNTAAVAPTGLTDEGLKFIFESDKLDFRSEVYKFMIVTWYLENTTKAQYELSFKSRVSEGESEINRLIDPNNYMLIKEMIANKYFAKWEVELDADRSKQFTDAKGMYFDDAIKYLVKNKDNINQSTETPKLKEFNSLVKRSDQMAQFKNESFDPLDTAIISATSGTAIKDNNATTPADIKYDALFGYKGITTMSAVGTGTMSFTLDKMKEVTNVTPGADGSLGTADDGIKSKVSLDTNWDGFIVKDDLNRATSVTVDNNHDGRVSDDELNKYGIRLVPENGEIAKLTYVHGIMPVWNGTNFVFNMPVRSSADDIKEYKHSVAQVIAINKTDYYNDAVDFLRTSSNVKDDGTPIDPQAPYLAPTILEIKNDQYKDMILDAGYKFVDVRKV